ncbi:MAG: flagellar biosynthesis protein FlhB [Rhodospirillaceae bacterium]|jgi:flagellar biosynthesis protein FlhB|nr:flagellar biosynthesis protein FlhB [Rhodospirillaceae bacterium]MBT6116928.1 flagellar biosynthesis protein FlhB [Rhodospirillaceae bacterium]
MAEGQDQSQKTEEPTQKRLDDSRRKGQVATSREVNHWFMLIAGAMVVMMLAPTMMAALGQAMRPFVERPHAIPIGTRGMEVMGALAAEVGGAMLMPLTLLVLAAALSGLVQNGPMLAPEQIKPKLEKISLGSGLKRLFSLRSIAEFVKGLLKLVIVATISAILMIPAFDEIGRTVHLEAGGLLALLRDLSLRLLLGVVAVMTVIAGLDFLYQRFEHLKKMRMSRQELKDEYKESEGDPQIKARLRQLRQERASRRMMAAVPKADVVVTNPTHVSVALSYEPGVMNAPKVVAKGVDRVALRIREVAREHDVPLVENPPLARALQAGVELDQEIPQEHYKAVAEIVGYVMRLGRRGRRG